MDNINFINNLQNLTNDRFSLTHLDIKEFGAFHHQFLSSFNANSISNHHIEQSNTTQDWYLIGTEGCHLCHLSHALLTQIKAMHHQMPNFYELDLMDGDDKIIDHLGTLIPMLLTPSCLLCYPFGVMDIINLFTPTAT